MTVAGNTTITRWQPWTFRDAGWTRSDVTGYHVDALDGEIGKVDKATFDVAGSYLVIDTGPWIFGRKVMLPAGVVSGVDHQNKRVFVERTKELIKNAPELDESMLKDTNYRDSFGRYYGEGGAGWYEGGGLR
jgi:hypothetical protein